MVEPVWVRVELGVPVKDAVCEGVLDALAVMLGVNVSD